MDGVNWTAADLAKYQLGILQDVLSRLEELLELDFEVLMVNTGACNVLARQLSDALKVDAQEAFENFFEPVFYCGTCVHGSFAAGLFNATFRNLEETVQRLRRHPAYIEAELGFPVPLGVAAEALLLGVDQAKRHLPPEENLLDLARRGRRRSQPFKVTLFPDWDTTTSVLYTPRGSCQARCNFVPTIRGWQACGPFMDGRVYVKGPRYGTEQEVADMLWEYWLSTPQDARTLRTPDVSDK